MGVDLLPLRGFAGLLSPSPTPCPTPSDSCLLVQAYYVWMDNDPHCSRNAKKGFTLYAAVYAAFDIYGMLF